MNDLERYFNENEYRLIDKWHHYFEIYDRHLSRFRNTEVNIVEIGIFHGGSLPMWREYFGPEANVYGVDINPRTKKFAEDRIHVRIGDQTDERFLRELAAEVPRIDVLIDDGGHTMQQQKTTLDVMLPLMAPDAVYICEDTHTSYWTAYGGGYQKKSSFIEHTKNLIDSLNAWHSHSRRLDVDDFTESVHGMHFYDSVVVIEKRPMAPPIDSTMGPRQFDERLVDRIYAKSPESLKPSMEATSVWLSRARQRVSRVVGRVRDR